MQQIYPFGKGGVGKMECKGRVAIKRKCRKVAIRIAELDITIGKLTLEFQSCHYNREVDIRQTKQQKIQIKRGIFNDYQTKGDSS